MALEKGFQDFEKALSRFREAYTRARDKSGTDDYYFFKDSSIQRFEFTVEIFWKFIKRFLKEKEGIDCNTPKSCIRDFFRPDIFSRFEDYIAALEEIILKIR